MVELPPARPQPDIVEAPLGVREYWFNTFYRVVVIPAGEGCYLLSMDVYVPSYQPTGRHLSTLRVEGEPVCIEYYELPDPPKPVRGRVEAAELVVLAYDGGRELVNIRMKVCGLREPPSREDVAELYRAVRERVGFKPARPLLKAKE